MERTDDDQFHWWEMGRKQVNDPIPFFARKPSKRLKEQVASSRHTDGANYLFADQHVKWSRFEALWGTTQETNAFWP